LIDLPGLSEQLAKSRFFALANAPLNRTHPFIQNAAMFASGSFASD